MSYPEVDLSEFVGKRVIATFRNGEIREGTIKEKTDGKWPYYLDGIGGTYGKNGFYWGDDYLTECDIVKIELVAPESQQQPQMEKNEQPTPEPKPMIDLSKYVDKAVRVTLYENTIYTGELRVYGTKEILGREVETYVFIPSGRGSLLYYKDGGNFFDCELDIVKIEELNEGQDQNPQQKTNSLEPKTLHTIASALAPEAIKFVESHEKYAEVMTELIEEFVKTNLGEVNAELPFMVFDRIFLAKGRD